MVNHGGCGFYNQTVLKITVTLGQIEISLESDKPYPDAAHDMANRAVELMTQSISQVKAANWNPFDVEIEETEED